MDYKIDGNIDFYKELQNMDPEDNIQNNQICLISREPLYGRYVSLECGHSFNYLPLFKDIYNHKKKFNFKEGKDSQLKINQIRCPYCRHIQNSVMPYYSEFNVEQHGINIIHPPIKKVLPVVVPKIISLGDEKQNEDILLSISLNKYNVSPQQPQHVNNSQALCIAILKYGSNKGSQCKNKVLCNFYCGRHGKPNINND
jgi:hypothetical protein